MIKEYFIINNIFNLLKVKIKQNYILIYIKVTKQFTKYYKYLLKYLYRIEPMEINTKIYNKYYKIIILNYPLCF